MCKLQKLSTGSLNNDEKFYLYIMLYEMAEFGCFNM